jgi:polyhydroxyalkanoate synthase
LGLNPPAFDVLSWNVDSTNLPATFHAEFIDLFLGNGLRTPGLMHALGTPVDLGTVKNDLYILGARNDHLVPWEATYAATQETSGEHRYVLSNSGHIQALVNPPGNPKATYSVGEAHPEDPAGWLEAATSQTGSWWTDWAAWTKERSGGMRKARRTLGSRSHRPIATAPGRYVLQR